jgi:glycosyltransferase involved in cell wall biosynthesis
MSKSDIPSDRRLLFASYHCYVDPSSGAAVSARELLVMLAQNGWNVRTYCGPLLDFGDGEDVRQILADQQLEVRETASRVEGFPAAWLTFNDGPVRSSVFVPPDPLRRPPSMESGSVFLNGFDELLDRWRPDILLTYGGHWLAGPMLSEARRRCIPVVFWLRNFAYRDPKPFLFVDRTIVPSDCSALHYRETLELETTVIPSPLDWERIVCDRAPGQRYVTFVNPQPHKGVFVFARIAEQLFRRRPDIPLLIVEGRSGVEWLERTELDLSGLTNLNVMKNTPDPRDFYRVSYVVLMPSLWRESFGRVAAEAMINGIPVLASNRGALPEVVSDAGFLFDLPERYTSESRGVPCVEEVSAWIETIIRLWDDRECYEEASRRCREHAECWRPKVLLPQYEKVFADLLGSKETHE